MARFKVCDNCGKKVEKSSNFCPHCKGESFKEIDTIGDIKYAFLYWDVDGGYILSKTKLLTLIVFLFCVIDWFIDWEFAIFGDVITAVAIFIVGYALHKVLKNDHPSENVVNNNDNGLINDLIHLFFYWQDKETGEYVISKTKLITLIGSAILALYYVMTTSGANLMQTLGASLVFGVPAFIIGYVIHRLINRE